MTAVYLLAALPLLWLACWLWRTGRRERAEQRAMRRDIRELTSDVTEN